MSCVGENPLRRYELATLAAARRLRSSYCVLAHGRVLAERFLGADALRADAVGGMGETSANAPPHTRNPRPQRPPARGPPHRAEGHRGETRRLAQPIRRRTPRRLHPLETPHEPTWQSGCLRSPRWSRSWRLRSGSTPSSSSAVAVYFWTASDEFLTYDIDVVMDVPEQLADLLVQLGFTRTADGRHWLLEGTDVFLEAPSARLDDDALVTKIELPSGRTASVLSRVDVLLDRLDELQGTGHLVVGQQVLALLGGMPDDEVADLDARAAHRRVTKILSAMRTLADGITAGRREPPESDELHEIARAALRAEYAPRSP